MSERAPTRRRRCLKREVRGKEFVTLRIREIKKGSSRRPKEGRGVQERVVYKTSTVRGCGTSAQTDFNGTLVPGEQGNALD